MLIKYISIYSILLFLSVSCRHETDLTSLKEVTYSSEIQPIIAGNCTQSGCHSGSNSGGHDGLFSLTSYEDVINRGGITAGNAHKSKLYNAICNKSFEELMPPKPLPKLSTDQIKLIYVWIEQGAKNN